MKNIFFSIAVIGFSIFSLAVSAQKDIPQAAKKGIEKSYPGAQDIKRDIEDGNYKAGFVSDRKHLSVLVDNNGSILETETKVAISALPAEAVTYLHKKFRKTIQITGAAAVKKANGKTLYEAEVNEKDYLFNEGRKFIK